MMSRPRRYLTRMGLFVLAVILVVAVLFQGVASAFGANPVLNGVIFAVLAIGIGFTFRSVLLLGPEIDWIETLRTHASVPEETRARTSLLAPLAALLSEARLERGRFVMSATAMRSVLDGLSTRMAEGREITRYLVGLLIFLGLLGTFWGLLQTISAVSDVIGDLTIETGDLAIVFGDLQQGLAAPLSGMGTAFSSSLFGLAGSLVLGFMELQATQAQNRFYNELEDWLSSVTRLTSGEAGDSLATPVVGAARASSLRDLQPLADQTAENVDQLAQLIAATEARQAAAVKALVELTARLGALDDHMRTQQSLMVRIAEGYTQLEPLLAALAKSSTEPGSGSAAQTLDRAEKSVELLRGIEAQLGHLVDSVERGRAVTVNELRAEIRLVARTIQEISEEPS